MSAKNPVFVHGMGVLCSRQIADRTQIPRSHFPRFEKSIVSALHGLTDMFRPTTETIVKSFLREVGHFCATMESGDIDNIRLNKR